MPEIVVMGHVPPDERAPAYLQPYLSSEFHVLLHDIPTMFYGEDALPYAQPSSPHHTALLMLGRMASTVAVGTMSVEIHYSGDWLSYYPPPSWDINDVLVARRAICEAAAAHRVGIEANKLTAGLTAFLPRFYLPEPQANTRRRHGIA